MMAFSNKQQINSMENLIQSLTDTKQDILNSDSEITVKSLNVSNIVVAGNITCPQFRSTKAVTNMTDIFPHHGNSLTVVTLVNSGVDCYGGTLVFQVNIGGYAKLQSSQEYTLTYVTQGGVVRATIPLQYFFNDSGIHEQWSRTHVESGVPAGTSMKLILRRSSSDLVNDGNDSVSVTIQEFPY